MAQRSLSSILIRSWYVLLVGAVLGVTAGFLVSAKATPMYDSTAQLFVSGSGTTSAADAFSSGQLAEARVVSYAQLLEGQSLAQRVISTLQLDETPSDLVSHIKALPVPDSVLINLTVSARSANLAQRIAQTTVSEFQTVVAQLEAPAEGAPPTIQAKVSEEATLPTAASTPRQGRDVALGGLAGLLIGALVSLARAPGKAAHVLTAVEDNVVIHGSVASEHGEPRAAPLL